MRRSLILLGIAIVVIGAAVYLVTLIQAPRVSDQEVRDALFTAIQRESPEAFLVTGRLDLTATTRVQNTKVLLPGLLDLDLGTNRATVRVPGRVSYGFHVDSLRPDMVQMLEDGSIEVELPPLSIYSVEPQLSRLEVETARGWARLGSEEEAVEQRALEIVERAMRRQAQAHLGSSHQPRINTARALEAVLTPALRGLGMDTPRFRFRIDQDLVVEPSG